MIEGPSYGDHVVYGPNGTDTARELNADALFSKLLVVGRTGGVHGMYDKLRLYLRSKSSNSGFSSSKNKTLFSLRL